ncbi:MAG: TRAP transporter TatT component family protein [Myxococcaceae bacterium]|nr:TRAP transporter TatT component family protein [Myxococcaceae bacterium]
MKAFGDWVSALAAVGLIGCSAGRNSAWEGPKEVQSSAQAAPADKLIAEGDEAWKNRNDAASVEKAIASWEGAVAANPNDTETLAKLPRAYYFLADAYYRGSDKYLDTFEKGVSAAERAMATSNPEFKKIVTSGGSVEDAAQKLTPKEAESAYWYASSLGKWARAKGFSTVLGNKDRIKAVMGKVLEVKPDLFHGGPDRYWGGYYAVAPGFAGGDMEKSKKHFESSLQLAPYYLGTKVLMADVYAVKVQDRALFDKLLDEVLAAPDDINPDLIPETRAEKVKAKELKAKAKELF